MGSFNQIKRLVSLINQQLSSRQKSGLTTNMCYSYYEEEKKWLDH